MEIVYFTLAGILLYLVSDWILSRIEQARGAPLPHRSLVFFAIILVLTLGLFQGIQQFIPPPSTEGNTPPERLQETGQ